MSVELQNSIYIYIYKDDNDGLKFCAIMRKVLHTRWKIVI